MINVRWMGKKLSLSRPILEPLVLQPDNLSSLLVLYIQGRHDSNQPSPKLHQAWVGSRLAVSHLSLSPTDSAAWTSFAQVRFLVIICRNSALQLTHFRQPTLREKSSSVETNECLLQYRHRNFRYKRNIWGSFLWLDSVSNWVFLIAVLLRVIGAIFVKAQAGTMAYLGELSLQYETSADFGILTLHGSLCLLIKFKSQHSRSCPKRTAASVIIAFFIICPNSHNNSFCVHFLVNKC